MSPFSRDYPEAREKFLKLAEDAGFRLVRYRVPADESPELFIDIALLRRDPTRVLLHVAGVHGIEGYVGSAVQAAALEKGFRGDGPSILFVHALNPYGMAYFRRGNAGNVDLNRNYLRKRDPSANQDYECFSSYLGPRNEIEFLTGMLKGWFHYFRMGRARAAQAIASGQARNADGLFYSGTQVAREILLLQEFLRAHCKEAKQALAIDVHSGLGAYGEELLFVDEEVDESAPAFFAEAFGRPVTIPDPKDGTYENSGRFSDSLRDALPGVKLHYVLQEFGTYSGPKVLGALRRENYEWRRHRVGSREHDRAATRVYEAFCPADGKWRNNVIEKGLLRIEQAMKRL